MIQEQTPFSNQVSKQLSPYTYISSLNEESDDDSILNAVKIICTSPDKSTFILEDYLISLDFVREKRKNLIKIRDDLGFVKSSSLFTQVGHSLDLLTLQDEVTGYDHRSNQYNMFSQINIGIDLLDSYQVILNNLIVQYEIK